MKFFTLDRMLKTDAQYMIALGTRSTGKSYAPLKYAIEQYLKNGSQTAYVRRMEEDFRGKRGDRVVSNMLCNGYGRNVVKDLSNGQWNDIRYYSGRWFLQRTEDGEDPVRDATPFMIAFALSGGEHDKSGGYPLIRTILFDEIVARQIYLPDEFVLFMNLVSTIVRHRNNVKIFMLGNSISKYCPYFSEMGLKNVKNMKPGDLQIYKYGDSGLKVAVEFTDRISKSVPSDVYFAFDNPKLSMITGLGDVWEMQIYPHCPEKYVPKDIIYTYFIEWDDELYQCEIVSRPDKVFTFIHRKTTPLQDPDNDLIFSPKDDPRPNWRKNIRKGAVIKNLYSFFEFNKVFYQDNEVGEAITAFRLWSIKQ